MIGIYGGTFDPIHYGHLRTALEVKEALELDELRFVPCRHPPHRDTPGATPVQRLAMLRLALSGAEPGFVLDTRELERDGPSYMVDTLASLRAEQPETPLCLILGMDAFRGLTQWHRWRELPELAHLAIMQRPSTEFSLWDADLSACLNQRLCVDALDLRGKPAGLVHFVTVSQLAISATEIRALIRAGHSPRYLLPDATLDYLRVNRLYQKN